MCTYTEYRQQHKNCVQIVVIKCRVYELLYVVLWVDTKKKKDNEYFENMLLIMVHLLLFFLFWLLCVSFLFSLVRTYRVRCVGCVISGSRNSPQLQIQIQYIVWPCTL